MSDLHFFLNLYPLLPKNDNKKILNKFRLKLTDWLLNGPVTSQYRQLDLDDVRSPTIYNMSYKLIEV